MRDTPACMCCARALPHAMAKLDVVSLKTGEPAQVWLCSTCIERDSATWRLHWRLAEAER
jgi:hypothetical protein